MHIRTLDYVDHEQLLKNHSEETVYILDFMIDAGFSTRLAVINRIFKKKEAKSVSCSVKTPGIELIFENFRIDENIIIREIYLDVAGPSTYEVTEQYLVSVIFSLKKINLPDLPLNNTDGKISNIDILSIKSCDFFEKVITNIINEIISYIEMSGYFSKLVMATPNLYLISDSKEYRITQLGGGIETAGHNPLHPFLIKKNDIIKNYKLHSKLDNKIKTVYRKGIHYKFMGFYDESFLCFYKVIEIIFKDESFSKKISKKIFNFENKNITSTMKGANQKSMILFIYLYFYGDNTDTSDDDRKNILQKMISASELRNNIAHSSDKSEESKKLIPIVIALAKIMIAETME